MIIRKKSKSLALFILSIAFSAFNSFGVAQVYKIIPASSSMTIFGTTNVHDFQSKVGQISGEVVINASKQVQSLSVDVPVKGIKSNEKAMDNKTYEAFKSDKNPNISFRLIEVGSLQINDNEMEGIVSGNLTMAGVTRKVSFKAIGKSNKAGMYQVKGALPLKMTDFKMSPPTALMGMMKVGDAITLKFDVTIATPNMTNNN
ncbi:MAG: YceI family protein [Paludibacter sp.]